MITGSATSLNTFDIKRSRASVSFSAVMSTTLITRPSTSFPTR